MNTKNIKKQLEEIYWFNNFEESLKTKIIELGKYITFNKNQMIYERGNKCQSLDIIIDGNLKAYTLSESGTENVIFSFSKNSIIGGSLLFSPVSMYPMSIFCNKDCKLFKLSKESIISLIEDKTFALFFIKNLSKNALSLNKKVITYTQNTLRENILEYLQELKVIQRSSTVTLPITKNEMASIFGVQRQSLFRELKKLSDDKLIISNNRKITLLQ